MFLFSVPEQRGGLECLGRNAPCYYLPVAQSIHVSFRTMWDKHYLIAIIQCPFKIEYQKKLLLPDTYCLETRNFYPLRF
jgi:hypothetical protein